MSADLMEAVSSLSSATSRNSWAGSGRTLKLLARSFRDLFVVRHDDSARISVSVFGIVFFCYVWANSQLVIDATMSRQARIPSLLQYAGAELLARPSIES